MEGTNTTVSSTPCDWHDVVTEMGSRFTSLNAIPVERATIKRHEWEAILQKLHDLLPADETFDVQNARRYEVLTWYVEPRVLYDKLVRAGNSPGAWKDLPEDQTIRQKLDELCDGVLSRDAVKAVAPLPRLSELSCTNVPGLIAHNNAAVDLAHERLIRINELEAELKLTKVNERCICLCPFDTKPGHHHSLSCPNFRNAGEQQ